MSSSCRGRNCAMWCLPRWRSVRSAVASTVESISRARFLCSHVPPSMMPRSASSVVSPLSSRSARDWYSRRLVDDQGERARAATRITIHTHPKCLCAPNPPLVLEVGGVCRGTISLSRVADALLEQLHFTLHFQLPTRHGVLRRRVARPPLRLRHPTGSDVCSAAHLPRCGAQRWQRWLPLRPRPPRRPHSPMEP